MLGGSLCLIILLWKKSVAKTVLRKSQLGTVDWIAFWGFPKSAFLQHPFRNWFFQSKAPIQDRSFNTRFTFILWRLGSFDTLSRRGRRWIWSNSHCHLGVFWKTSGMLPRTSAWAIERSLEAEPRSAFARSRKRGLIARYYSTLVLAYSTNVFVVCVA